MFQGEGSHNVIVLQDLRFSLQYCNVSMFSLFCFFPAAQSRTFKGWVRHLLLKIPHSRRGRSIFYKLVVFWALFLAIFNLYSPSILLFVHFFHISRHKRGLYIYLRYLTRAGTASSVGPRPRRAARDWEGSLPSLPRGQTSPTVVNVLSTSGKLDAGILHFFNLIFVISRAS